ncbi:MAG: 16S rRNA (guanine(966)-N(2))-methyltransferase RsmD [Myxococcales bacterium]|nr:16S rRNA (guanine(966)-N(2))-methyltransferase RsmD [Myxococcales bacterium]
MRIISGRWRGRRLLGPKDAEVTRPTSDRAREALFNLLGPRILKGPFIDLYAGTGAVGLEAASRGAPSVILVENAKPALALCRANIDKVNASQVELRSANASRPGPLPMAQVAFADPPYDLPLEEAMNALLACKLREQGCWVLERRSSEPLPALPESVAMTSDRVYGAARLLIMEKAL